MSSVAPAPRSKVAARVALIRARSGISPLGILVLPPAAFAYAYYALEAELIGQSVPAVAIFTTLFVLCGAGMLLRTSTDRLELFRVFSLYYLMAYCVCALFEPAISDYVFEDPKPELLESTAWLSLYAYVSIALGYHLPLFRRAPKHVLNRHDEYSVPLVTALGLGFFVVGVISFAALFVFAGGAAVILRGEGALQRTEFSFGLGWYYWASLFMVPGGALYFAAQTVKRRPLAWLHAWPLFATFSLLMLLQGRHRALGPMLVMFYVSNYMIRRLRLPRLAAYAVAGMAVAVVMNAWRSPALRGTFAADPVQSTALALEGFSESSRDELSGAIARIDEVMLVIDHVPDRMPYDRGESLTIWLNPFRRLIWKDRPQVDNIGNRIYDIARPETRNSPYRTGILPSIVGEMRANFPALLCFFPYLLYGIAMRLVYQRLILQRADFVSVAAYAILLFHVCNMVIGTFAQDFFEIMVVVAPVFLCRALARRRPRHAASRR